MAGAGAGSGTHHPLGCADPGFRAVKAGYVNQSGTSDRNHSLRTHLEPS
jgi:hypothetical protein